MPKEKILVTGAGGFIGSIATDLLLKKGYPVVALDNYSTGFESPLKHLHSQYPSKLSIYQTNISHNLDPIFEKEKDIKAVLHYAAYCLVNESMENPDKYFSNNVCATQSFLSQLVKHGIKKIVFSSTCAVYGEAQTIPITEDHPTNPTNPYGLSKLASELMIKGYAQAGKLDYAIMRYFNVCGASDDSTIGDSKKPSVLLVQNAVRGTLGIEPFKLTCPLVDTHDKTPIRDYINVVDLNEAHEKALNHLLKGGENITLNLGTGTGNSVLEIIEKVQKVTGVKFDIGKTTPRKGEYATMFADITKAQKILGWKPARSIEDSIKSLVAWYKTHPQGWEN